MNKLLISALMLSSVMPVLSFAAISEQDKLSFQYKYGSQMTPATSAKILNFCEKNDTTIESCMSKLKAQPSQKKSVQNNGNYCCWNVSNQLGDHVYYQGQDYCFHPCSL